MKRAELISKIRKQARKANVTWELSRQGKRHEMWRIGAAEVQIPRHSEINEYTAEGILKHTETELGERWWQ